MSVVRRVSDKGQITIPKEVRDILDIHAGDFVEMEIVAVHRVDQADDGHDLHDPVTVHVVKGGSA